MLSPSKIIGSFSNSENKGPFTYRRLSSTRLTNPPIVPPGDFISLVFVEIPF